MFSVFKFIYTLFKSFPDLLKIDRNALKNIPNESKYLAMIMLSCFWCLAFGLFFGELLTIGYNMFGHVAIITMAFVTWYVFRGYQKTNQKRDVDYLRSPDRSSRCDEYTDEQRLLLAKKHEAVVPV